MGIPYSSTQGASARGIAAFRETCEYGGIRRPNYLGIMIGIGVLQMSVEVGTPRGSRYAGASAAAAIAGVLIGLFPAYHRLKNIGTNPWWCLLMLVPIANLWIMVRCLVMPEGYADSKELDTAAKVSVGLILGVFAICLLAAVVLLMAP